MLLLAASPVAARDLPGDYFPDGTFSHFETEEWYGPYLFALHEPSLYRLSQQSSTSIYRITILPPFADYFSLTLYVQSDGTGRLDFKRAAQIVTTANGGGYVPGTVRQHSVFLLSANQVRDFERSLDFIHFWRLPVNRQSDMLDDANTFLYEAARAGRYHVIEVAEPGYPTLLAPARLLMRYAGERLPD